MGRYIFVVCVLISGNAGAATSTRCRMLDPNQMTILAIKAGWTWSNSLAILYEGKPIFVIGNVTLETEGMQVETTHFSGSYRDYSIDKFKQTLQTRLNSAKARGEQVALVSSADREEDVLAARCD